MTKYQIAKEDGWGDFECSHGYGIFTSEYPTDFGDIEALHIERIDIMEMFVSDEEAANHFEANEGIKIIRDIPNLPQVFIDTPTNRTRIMKHIKGGN